MDDRLKRAPGIYLAGFMGSGKTTVGRALADRVGWDFVDIDAEIEDQEHSSIARIFGRNTAKPDSARRKQRPSGGGLAGLNAAAACGRTGRRCVRESGKL